MKKFIILLCTLFVSYYLFAQDSTRIRNARSSKEERRAERRQRINTIARQEEEGILNFDKQTAFGVELRTNGYGVFYELGRMKTPRFANIYAVELTEIKHLKEEKLGGNFFANAFVYGKISNFYQVKLGYGQQYVFGERGNKNGVAVTGIYQGGLSIGLLKPYYLQVEDASRRARYIKYESEDSALFLDQSAIIGGGGFGKGWSELKFRPGAYLKGALRFDFGHFNESLEALEIGISVEAYAQKIKIMAYNPDRRFFYQGHIAFVFGRRR